MLVLDTHRTAVHDLKEHLAGHADRILEIDLRATNHLGEAVSAGWNPLDLTVVPPEMRKGRIDTLKGMLPVALFPDYFGPNSKSPQTSAIIRKTLECLLHLNLRLPAELQANIFCYRGPVVGRNAWREQAISQLPARDQKWWTHTYPMIVGQKGASSTALKPALNALEQWKSQDRIQALLGASISTVRWREIIDESKIVFVALNNDGSETDNLLARLLVGEMVAAFKERGLSPNGNVRPFHLFLDEFQSYAPVLEVQAEVIVQELRKFGAKVHFLCQSPSVLSKRMREIIFANCTHVFCGRLGNPSDAEQMAKLMGGHHGLPPERDHRFGNGRRSGPARFAPVAFRLPGHPGGGTVRSVPAQRNRHQKGLGTSANRSGHQPPNRSQHRPGTRRGKTRPLRHPPRAHLTLAHPKHDRTHTGVTVCAHPPRPLFPTPPLLVCSPGCPRRSRGRTYRTPSQELLVLSPLEARVEP